MTYCDQRHGTDHEPRGNGHDLRAFGLAGGRPRHGVFAVVSEQVVALGFAPGGLVRVVERSRASRFVESPCVQSLAAPKVLHGGDVFAAPGRVVQDLAVVQGDALVHDRSLAPEDDIAG